MEDPDVSPQGRARLLSQPTEAPQYPPFSGRRTLSSRSPGQARLSPSSCSLASSSPPGSTGTRVLNPLAGAPFGGSSCQLLLLPVSSYVASACSPHAAACSALHGGAPGLSFCSSLWARGNQMLGTAPSRTEPHLFRQKVISAESTAPGWDQQQLPACAEVCRDPLDDVVTFSFLWPSPLQSLAQSGRSPARLGLKCNCDISKPFSVSSLYLHKIWFKIN